MAVKKFENRSTLTSVMMSNQMSCLLSYNVVLVNIITNIFQLVWSQSHNSIVCMSKCVQQLFTAAAGRPSHTGKCLANEED